MATAIVLGAGPAGLAAGLALAHAGWKVRVFEQANMVGGLARTIEHNGFRFDIGGHRWFTKKDELNLFLVNLLGDELRMVDRISRVYFDGKYVHYPLRIGNVLAHVGPTTGARAVVDFMASQASRVLTGKPVVSMEDAYVAQFGRTLYELFFRNYSEKVWGLGCDALSGDWVSQRSKGLTLLTAVTDAVTRQNGKTESLVSRFMYPSLGYGRISERMAEEIEHTGGEVHLGWRVTSVRHDGHKVRGVTVSDGTREQIIEGDEFISSIPMTELGQSMDPAADSRVVAAADSLSYRALITVHLMLDRPQVTNDTWIYVHEPRVRFARMHEPRNWSPELAPPGKTSLVLEFFCDVGDPTWERSDDEVCQMAVEDLSDGLKLIERRDVMDAFAVRSRDAYPRYSLGYRAAVDTLKRHLAGYDNLSLVGRGGMFRYNNADHAIETGFRAARKVLGDDVDVDEVNAAPEYLEERVVPPVKAHRNGTATAQPDGWPSLG
jgi:protoporphyrinogen oxidase